MPVAMAKHGRPVVVVMAVEEFERLKTLDLSATAPEIICWLPGSTRHLNSWTTS